MTTPHHRLAEVCGWRAAWRAYSLSLLLGLVIAAFSRGCGEPVGPAPLGPPKIAIIREGPNAARLSGIGMIEGFARGRDNTFLHCLELVLEASGQKIGYDELMGISGMAFRIRFRVDRWDVGNPDPVVGENSLDDLFAAVGWSYELRVVRRDELGEAEALREAIRRSIDSGMPVLAANIIPPENWGIITGYRADQSWLCRAYNGSSRRTDQLAKGWPTAVVLLTRRQVKPLTTEAHAAAIRRAAELFGSRGSGPYALGEKAFDEWCQSLRTARGRSYIHPNFWTYVSLIDARGAAVRYLRGIAGQFGAREMHVSMAADWYEQEVRLLLRGLEHVPPEERFKGEDSPLVEVRNRQIEVLREAQKLEQKAMDALGKVQ